MNIIQRINSKPIVFLSMLVITMGCDDKENIQKRDNIASPEYLNTLNTEASSINLDKKTKIDAFREFQKAFRGEATGSNKNYNMNKNLK